MTNFNLTENEAKAVAVLSKEVLFQTGADTFSEIAEDELYLIVEPSMLVDAGWSVSEAAGTWGALEAKWAIEIGADRINGFDIDVITADAMAWNELQRNAA